MRCSSTGLEEEERQASVVLRVSCAKPITWDGERTGVATMMDIWGFERSAVTAGML